MNQLREVGNKERGRVAFLKPNYTQEIISVLAKCVDIIKTLQECPKKMQDENADLETCIQTIETSTVQSIFIIDLLYQLCCLKLNSTIANSFLSRELRGANIMLANVFNINLQMFESLQKNRFFTSTAQNIGKNIEEDKTNFILISRFLDVMIYLTESLEVDEVNFQHIICGNITNDLNLHQIIYLIQNDQKKLEQSVKQIQLAISRIPLAFPVFTVAISQNKNKQEILAETIFDLKSILDIVRLIKFIKLPRHNISYSDDFETQSSLLQQVESKDLQKLLFAILEILFNAEKYSESFVEIYFGLSSDGIFEVRITNNIDTKNSSFVHKGGQGTKIIDTTLAQIGARRIAYGSQEDGTYLDGLTLNLENYLPHPKKPGGDQINY